MSQQKVLTSFAKPEKYYESETRSSIISQTLSWMSKDIQSSFVPPPPRPPYLEQLVSDGLTTCDLCGWAWSKKKFFSLEGYGEQNHNDYMWIFLLIVVTFSSALIGAIIMVTAIKYRRSNVLRVTKSYSEKKDFGSDQNFSETKNPTNVDIKYVENDDNFYSTLDDQDSINSEKHNMAKYNRKNCDSGKKFENEMPSAPASSSSAYYSNLSNPDKQYECIDSFATYLKSDFNTCSGGNSFITLNTNVIMNRLSAISENNFSNQHRDVSSEYV
ncbi:CLUMA_CG017532, isoform A [Clunio marinus]|uniref:CLUMA_CG017532, isoform A n=1 Tax=Clunio marinus TaxID=568069 RepID=A0A1J1IWG7_9DIPT|nr:CLUMA_CG017532, isoform A [Clunio marinus]